MSSVEESMEYVPNEVRCCNLDKMLYLNVIDFVSAWCNWEVKKAWDFWHTLPESSMNEFKDHIKQCRASREDKNNWTGISFPGAMKLSSILPAKDPKANMVIFTKILYRYFLFNPEDSKAFFNKPVGEEPTGSIPGPMTPITSLAPGRVEGSSTAGPLKKTETSLVPDRVDGSSTAVPPKRTESKKRERELEEMEMKERETRWKSEEFQNVCAFVNLMNSVDNNWAEDARQMMRATDWIKTIAFGKPTVPLSQPLTVRTVARELCHQLTSQQIAEIDRNVCAAYKARYLIFPYLSVEGAYVLSERDRFLISAEITSYVERL